MASAGSMERVMERILGGSVLGVIIRLVVVSIIVGFVLSWLEISPVDLFDILRDLGDWIYERGFETAEWLLPYFLIGAAVVVPVWLIYRLLKMLVGGDKGAR